MKKIVRYLGFLLFAMMLAAPAYSHQLWLNMTDYTPDLWQHPKYAPTPRAKTIAYFGWGHTYPVGDFLGKSYLETMTQIEPDGTKKEITVGESGFREVEIKMESEGARIFAAEVNPGKHGDMWYEMYAKALVGVGEIKGNPYSRPSGQKVEIIPETNPNALKPGDTLSLKVLADGKPAADYDITAVPMFLGMEESEQTMTNSYGKAVVNIKSYYGPWVIIATKTEPAKGKMAEECKTFYRLATMTFAVEK